MSTYWQAGVNIEEGERAVELMKTHVATAQRSESIGEIGGFAGQFDASALKYPYRYPKPEPQPYCLHVML